MMITDYSPSLNDSSLQGKNFIVLFATEEMLNKYLLHKEKIKTKQSNRIVRDLELPWTG